MFAVLCSVPVVHGSAAATASAIIRIARSGKPLSFFDFDGLVTSSDDGWLDGPSFAPLNDVDEDQDEVALDDRSLIDDEAYLEAQMRDHGSRRGTAEQGREQEEEEEEEEFAVEEIMEDGAQVEVNAADASTRISHMDATSTSTRMLEWLLSEGSRFSGIKVTEADPLTGDYGRSVRSTKKFRPSEVIMEISLANLITPELALRRSQTARAFYNSWNTRSQSEQYLREKALISIFICEEWVTEGSDFSPYLDSLPHDFGYLPSSWSDETLRDWFRGSPLLKDVLGRKQDLVSEYERILSVDPDFAAKIDYDTYYWARSCVSTRAFRIYPHGQLNRKKEREQTAVSTLAMVPLADLLNHRKDPKTVWSYDPDKKSFVVTATRYISNGEHIFDSYGQKTNDVFLLNFGFTSSEIDISLRLYFDSSDCEKANEVARKFLLDSQEVSEPGRPVSSSMIYQVGVDFDNVMQSILVSLREMVPSSLRFRKSWWSCVLMQAKLQHLLSGYPTSIEEDEALMQQESTDTGGASNFKNALRIRLGEKKVLKRWLDFYSTARELIEAHPSTVKSVIYATDGSVGAVLPFSSFGDSNPRALPARIGDTVLAQWQGGSTFYDGTVVASHDDGSSFDVLFSDGDFAAKVPLSNLVLVPIPEAEHDPVDPALAFMELGSVCLWTTINYWTYKICPGRDILQYHVDTATKKLAVQYSLGEISRSSILQRSQDYTGGSDGRKSTIILTCRKAGMGSTKKKDLRALTSHKGTTHSPLAESPPVWQHVIVSISEPSERKYIIVIGTPLACRESAYALRDRLMEKFPIKEERKAKAGSGLKAGMHVYSRRSQGDKYFEADIERVHEDGTVDVRYTDSDLQERGVPVDFILPYLTHKGSRRV
eukprot:g4160.t1